MLITVTIALAAVILAILAIATAYVLGWANRAFHVEVDPKVEALIDTLPGANCGGCGYVGCGEYAEAVARLDAGVDLCGPGGGACAGQLAEIMGITLHETFPYRAVVQCAGRRDERLGRMPPQPAHRDRITEPDSSRSDRGQYTRPPCPTTPSSRSPSRPLRSPEQR